MKKVKCIISADEPILVLNNTYNVIFENEHFYALLECGVDNWFTKNRFEVIEDTETPIKPNHYKTNITPIEYIEANNLGFHEGNVIKYITRYKEKNGIEDLEKAKTYIEMLIDKLKRENV